MAYKNFIFDLGGVILDINMQKALDGFAALGLPESELRFDVGEAADLMHRYQLGHFTTDEFCRRLATRCNPGTTPEQVAHAWNSICLGIPKRKLDAIKALKQRANVYLLSNTNDLHWQYCLDHWFNANGNRCEDFFDKVFLSQEMHLEKPHAEIFEQVIKTIDAGRGSETSDTIFLDDNIDNVNAAKNCCIQAVQITPDFDWVDYLKALD
ncbi:HAD family phosphatase [Fibrobacter sp. UWB10]|uniref:HAD family hydrolase n=1 Tax=Fibrobacter sp. UWB10 TaxID=1896201 RepID=UPI00240376AE|nr:HAD family phosphatase [Fibrobacter sp. UWB10]SMP38860.1 putative hydrolase of the HAD superfamily [Fibrobacter sp. UWB10]